MVDWMHTDERQGYGRNHGVERGGGGVFFEVVTECVSRLIFNTSGQIAQLNIVYGFETENMAS